MLNFYRDAVSIFGLEIRYYGLLMMLGILLGVMLCVKREKRLALPKDTTLNIALICVPTAIVAARLYYVAFSWEYYANDPIKIFAIREGGMAIYGGIIGGFIAGYIYAKVKRVSIYKLMDLAAPSLALGQAIGRWGNLINQEAYGGIVENAALQWFPFAVYIEAAGEYHYATFFYESAWCFLIVAFLLIGERRDWFKRSGDMFFWYTLLYGVERAFVEGLRTDSLYWGGVRVSQILSIALVVFSAVMLAFRRENADNKI